LPMLISTVKRALRDIRNNLYLHAVCVVTIALAVFILGAFSLFYVNATELLDAWKKGVRVMVYLDQGISESRRAEIASRIEGFDAVAAVSFVPKKQAFEALQADIGKQSELLAGLKENPLPDAFEVRLAGSVANLGDVGGIAVGVASIEGVDDVEYARKWLSQFAGVYKLFKVTGMVLVAMFFLAIVFIVANTLRLILYARREEIEVMWIVGADESFIKFPFYLEGLLLGLAGGVLGLAVLYAAYFSTVPQFAPDVLFSFYEIRFLPAGIWMLLLLASMMVGCAGCHFSIKRFIRI